MSKRGSGMMGGVREFKDISLSEIWNRDYEKR